MLVVYLHVEHLQALTHEIEKSEPNLLPQNEMFSVCMPIAHAFFLCQYNIGNICGPRPFEPTEPFSAKRSSGVLDSSPMLSNKDPANLVSCTNRLLRQQNRTDCLFRVMRCTLLDQIKVTYNKADGQDVKNDNQLKRVETYLNFGLFCISFQLSTLKYQTLTLNGISNLTDVYLYSHAVRTYPTDPNEFVAVLPAGHDVFTRILVTQHLYNPLESSWLNMLHDWLLSWLPNCRLEFDRLCAQQCEKQSGQPKTQEPTANQGEHSQIQSETYLNYLYTFLYQDNSSVQLSRSMKVFSEQCVRSCRVQPQAQQVFNAKYKIFGHEMKPKLQWIRRLKLLQQRRLSTLEYFLYLCVLFGSVYGWWPVRLIRRLTASPEELAVNQQVRMESRRLVPRASNWARRESPISDAILPRSKANSRTDWQTDDVRWNQGRLNCAGDAVNGRNAFQPFNAGSFFDARRLPVRAHSFRPRRMLAGQRLTPVESIDARIESHGTGTADWSNASASVHVLSDRQMKSSDKFWLSTSTGKPRSAQCQVFTWEQSWRQGLHRMRFAIRLLLMAAGGLFWLKMYWNRQEHNQVNFIMDSHGFMLSRFTLHMCFRIEDISLNDPNQDLGLDSSITIPKSRTSPENTANVEKQTHFRQNHSTDTVGKLSPPFPPQSPFSAHVQEDDHHLDSLTNRTFGELMVNTKRLDQLLDGVMADNYVVASFYNPSYVRHKSLTYLQDGMKCFGLQVNLPELLIDLHSELNRFVFRRRYQIVFNFARKVSYYQLFAYEQKRRQLKRYKRQTTDFKAVQFHDLKGGHCADYGGQTFTVANQRCQSYDDCYNRCVLHEHLAKYQAHCRNCWVPEQFDLEGRLCNSETGFVERDDEILHSKCKRLFPIDCERFDFYGYKTRSTKLDRTIQLSLQMPHTKVFIFEPVSRLLFLLQFACLLQAIALDGIYSMGKQLQWICSTSRRFVRWLFGADTQRNAIKSNSGSNNAATTTAAAAAVMVRQQSLLQRFPVCSNTGAKTSAQSENNSRSRSVLGGSSTTMVTNRSNNGKLIDHQSIDNNKNGFRWLISWQWLVCLLFYTSGVAGFLIALRSVHQRIRVSHTYESMHLQPRNEHLPAVFVCIPFADETPVRKLEDDVLYEVDRLNGFSIKQLQQQNHSLSSQFQSIYFARDERKGGLLNDQQMDRLWKKGRLGNLQFSFVYYRLRICFGFRVHLRSSLDGWRSVAEEPRKPLIAFRLRHRTPADVYIGPDLENLLSHTIHQTLSENTQYDYITQLIVRSGRYDDCRHAEFGANHRLIVRSIKQSFAQHHFTTNHLPIEQTEYRYTINNFDFLKDVAQFDVLYRRLVEQEPCEKRFKLRQTSRSLSAFNITVMEPRSVEVLLLHSNRALGLIFIHLLAFISFLTQAGVAELFDRQTNGEPVWTPNFF